MPEVSGCDEIATAEEAAVIRPVARAPRARLVLAGRPDDRCPTVRAAAAAMAPRG